MDFRREVQGLLSQIPPGRVVRVADLARALGDLRSAPALSRFLRHNTSLTGAERVIRSDGGAVVDGRTTRGPREFREFQSKEPLAVLREEQERVAAEVSRRDEFGTVRTVGGVDVSYDGDRGFASLVVLRASDLAVVEEVILAEEVPFPYIPTYLAYREWPIVASAFARLDEPPTILLVDGHGELHPSRCGIACHIGVKLNIPTIGIAKRPLIGAAGSPLKIGEATALRHGGRVLGYAFRSSASLQPLYVSTGHRVNPRTALRLVRRLCRSRHPEPLRLAHAKATAMKREKKNVQDGSISLPAPKGGKPKAKEEPSASSSSCPSSSFSPKGSSVLRV